MTDSSQPSLFEDDDFSTSELKYLFYDDETANSEQNICAAGFVCTDGEGRELFKRYQLINPENAFGTFETRVHGITESDVKDKMNFHEFYVNNNFQELLSSCIVVMHNARSADLAHIRKSCQRYGIVMPKVSYLDTERLSEQIPNIGSHDLKTVSAHYGVRLEKHHNALADAQACCEIFWKIVDEFGLPEDPLTYDPQSLVKRPNRDTHKSPTPNRGPVVNGSNQPVEEVLDEFKSLGLLADACSIGELGPCPIVFSGSLPSCSQDEINNLLVEKGYDPKKNLSKKTKFLAVGNNVGQRKIEDARKRGIPIFPLSDLVKMLENQ